MDPDPLDPEQLQAQRDLQSLYARARRQERYDGVVKRLAAALVRAVLEADPGQLPAGVRAGRAALMAAQEEGDRE